MSVTEIQAKTVLRKQRKVDSWFVSRYGMNLYRGCAHNCVYCDGRAERYRVEGEFGRDVAVKVNAIDVLRRELDPARKRVPLKRSFVMMGGGVGDGYQPLEQHYQLTRQALQLMAERQLPVHVLTKSTLVERDMDILSDINGRSRAIVSCSFSSLDDAISAVFEPNVPSPSARLQTLVNIKRQGIACGMFLLPVIPFVTDSPNHIDQAVAAAREAGLDFVIFGGMTLKGGRQRDYFMDVLNRHHPRLVTEYASIYHDDGWGNATPEYYQQLHEHFRRVSATHRIPCRVPARLFSDLLDENDRVVVLLEQISYLLKLQGRTSPYGYAARSVSQLKEPLSTMRSKLRSLKGVGKHTERLILEILETGRSDYYEKLLAG